MKKNLFLIRFSSLRKSIKYILIVAFISILIIELILKNYKSPNHTFYQAGDIYLKFCYSFCAATIFYFFIQHLPREERKAKSYRFINNKISALYNEVSYLLRNINIDTRDKLKEITKEYVAISCLNINPQASFSSPDESHTLFDNWFDYLNYKSKRIREIIKDILILNESLDIELMEHILTIEDLTYNRLFFDKKKWTNDNLQVLDLFIFEIYKHSEKCLELVYTKYEKYGLEYRKRWKP